MLWGATGFTGRLVAEYLVGRPASGSVRLALAGRDRAKLEALRSDLAAVDRDRLTSRGGILTPAAAMGAVLTERLRTAGMRLQVTPVDS